MANNERAVSLGLPWTPDSDSPAPVVWQNEHRVVLAYRTAATAPGWPLAIIEFNSVLSATFGYPNDEALPGHPLYGAGLSFYDIFEVVDSSWLARLQQQNRVAFPDVAAWPSGSSATSKAPMRHFIITFHDSTFECLARTISGAFAASLPDAPSFAGGPTPA